MDPSEESEKKETEENNENVIPSSNLSTIDANGPTTSAIEQLQSSAGLSTKRKSSAMANVISKITNTFKKRYSSSANVEPSILADTEPSELSGVKIAESPPTSKTVVASTSKDASRESSKQEFVSEDEGSKRKSVLKRSEESPGVSNVASRPSRRKSYNPFWGFEKNIPISNPHVNKSYSRSNSYNRASNMSNIRERQKRSISVMDLSRQNIAFCFFPEEPDWDDDDDERLRRFSSGFGKSDYGDYYEDDDFEWNNRERWDSRLVYLIALVTYSISFSNIYHFPLLVYTYSGYFLIPYTIFTIILGYPIHFLESALGQYSQSGLVKVWDSVPIARGVGWSMFILCFFIAYFYNMYAAYSVVYFSRCFNSILPWQDCNETSVAHNFSCLPRMCARDNVDQHTPSEHYFIADVLNLDYLNNGLGSMEWKQLLGFFMAWFVVYVAILQSVRSIGKYVYLLIALPYFVLLMMLSAGFMLEGSSQAWYLLFGAPSTRKLFDVQMWRSAAEQVFFELGISQGIPLVYGSYCQHRNPTHIDSAIVCTINYFTSLLCALVLFNILGALSLELGTSNETVTNKVAGLVFIIYPDAICRVPGSNVWCVLFFFMLFSVIISTQIGIMETVMTVIFDKFPNTIPYRWFINLLICSGLFLAGLLLCTANGFFYVYLLDRMTGALPRLPIVVFMVGAIVFIYGMRKFCEDMHFMIDYFPNMFIRVCLFITPFLLMALTLTSWLTMDNLTVFGMEYDAGAIFMGWFTVWFILVWILIGAIYWVVYCYYTGKLKLICNSLNSWGPKNVISRIARTEFSSNHVDNFTKRWTIRQSSTYIED